MSGSRVLEVHRPTGFQDGGWPYCTACGPSASYPCWDVLRVIEAPR